MSATPNKPSCDDDIVVSQADGLYCGPGAVHIDPWRPVERAVITHAHADHARQGHAHYLCAAPCTALLRARLGDVSIQALEYGEHLRVGEATLSFHPAGHVLGSAQVRIEARGQVWVVSGDYKLAPDPTCPPFEPLRCDVFVTESTFGLPIYRWQSPQQLAHELDAWWEENARSGRCSVLYAYAFGKAQRIAAMLRAQPGPLLVHGAVAAMNEVYRAAGVDLPATEHATAFSDRAALARALVLAPPSAAGTPWTRRFGDFASAFASGWMQVRGARRQRRVERGFALSDHADWPALLAAIEATGAQRVLVTHDPIDALPRYLSEHGLQSSALATDYGDAEDPTLERKSRPQGAGS
jgi:putative mRNA 3-end processing factor